MDRLSLDSSAGAAADDGRQFPGALIELDPDQIESILRTVPGGSMNLKDVYPLSPIQEGMLFHHLLNERSDTYVVSTLLELESRLDLDRLINALQTVIDHHDILRTAVLWEQLPRPLQVVYRSANLPVADFSLDRSRDVVDQLKERMTPQRQRWNIGQAPLMRLQVTAAEDGKRWYGLLQLHHLVCDHESLKTVVAEAMAHIEGRSPEVVEPDLYRTHLLQTLENTKTREAEVFFRNKFSSIDEPTMPFGLSDVHGDGTQIEEARCLLDLELARRVRARAHDLGVTSARLFFAAWALVVSRTSGRDDVVFGTALLATRQRVARTLPTLGMFVNTLPLRLRLEGVTAKELVEQAQRELDELLKYGDTSLVVAQRCSGVNGSDPLFSSLMTYRHSVPNPQREWSQAAGIRVLTANQYRTNYPVTLTVDNLGEGFALTAQTDRRVDPARVARYLQTAVRSLVEALEKAPQTPALSLAILPETERFEVIEGFNATRTSFPERNLIHELFEEQVERAPDAAAAVCEGQTLTYAGLNGKANQLARYLIQQGMQVGEFIPIIMPRGLPMLIAQLAVLKCGGAYVPVDPMLPVERQIFMVRDCGAPRILGEAGGIAAFQGESIQYLDYAEVSEEIAGLLGENLRRRTTVQTPAYVMYTSGSTGIPKGVLVSQPAVSRLAINNGYAQIEPDDCVAHTSNPAFDASTFEVWGALLNGASLLIVPQSILLEGKRFARALADRHVTIMWLSVGLFMQYTEVLSEVFHLFRYLLVGGDIVEASAVRKVLSGRRPQHLLNGYGPTECTTFSTTYAIENVVSDAEIIPIGRPISNTQVYILDDRLRPVPIGVAGEIHIGGRGVAFGYLNRPELTAERFVADPFSACAGARFYKSGDLGRWRADGAIEFLRRVDDQVKIRGFRIEPGEIAARLLEHPHVREAVVLTREDEPGEKRLAAYVVPDVVRLRALQNETSSEVGTEIVSQWQKLYEETYSKGNGGPSFVGWNSSYTGEAIPRSEMQEWLANTLTRIKALRPRRVLEIGCGVGLLLEHLAPDCPVYVGTDFSGTAITQLQQWATRQRDLGHVKLLHRSALELDDLREHSFDTVILNSVVQYFPDIEYLVAVLEASIRLLEPGGKIFVGDVRDFGSLTTFHSAIQLEKASATTSVGQLKKRITRAVTQDKELVIDPEFFQALPGNLAGVSSVEAQLKRGHGENELTRYRYDVTLRVGAQTETRALCESLNWESAVGTVAKFEEALRCRNWRTVYLHSLPNQRVAREIAGRKLIESSDDRVEVAAVRSQLNQTSFEKVDPEEIWQKAEVLGYDVTVSPAEPGCFDIRLTDRARCNQLTREQPALAVPKSWSAYANDPLENGVRQRIVPQLREYLRDRVPEYMVPSIWIVLKHLPLTSNGKVDRRALPAPADRPEEMGEYIAPRTELERILAEIWVQLLPVDQVGVRDNFFELGGHSLLIVQLMERLHKVGLSTSVRSVYQNPTLEALANTLAGDQGGEFVAPPNLIPAECNAITPQMLPLVKLEQEEIARIVQSVPGGVVNIQDIYPLVSLQEGIFFHHLLSEKSGDTYILSMLLSLPSREKVDKLLVGFQELINRNDVLRTAIQWEHLPQPVQVVYRRATLPVEELVLDEGHDPVEQLKEWMKPGRQRLDLRTAPLMRLWLVPNRDGVQWYVLAQLHHLVCDHESVDIMLKELLSHIEEHAQELPAPVLYRNHVWQVLRYNQTQDTEQFFRDKIGDIDEPTAPFRLFDVYGDGSGIDRTVESLDPTVARRIRAEARRLGVSAATLFHAAWGLVISHTSDRHDVVYGTVLLGRLQGSAGPRASLGMFINTLPLRLSLQDVTAKELVEQTQSELGELLNHEQASLSVAQRCSGIGRTAPLFTTILNYRHGTTAVAAELAAATGMTLLDVRSATNYPLVLSVDDQGDGFVLDMEADERVGSRRMIGYVSTVLQSLVAALEGESKTPALALSILPESERQQVLELFNATHTAYPQHSLVHELFEEQVRRTPDAVAVIHESRCLTYAELNAKANQLAWYLRAREIGPDQLVGICIERGLEMVVGLLGILKAGGAYLPLDPSYPLERLQYMLQDVRPRLLLSQESLRKRLPPTSANLICLDSDWSRVASNSADNLDAGVLGLRSDHLAYVIYTSGSTGRPKGVAIEHRNTVNLIRWAHSAMPAALFMRTLHSTSLNFDLSVYECFVPLTMGASIHVVENAMDVSKVRPDVTLINTVPSAIRGIVDAGAIPRTTQGVNLAGEALTRDLVDRILQHGGVEYVCNLYGPSETTTYSTWISMSKESGFTATIGRPIANTQIYILDTYRLPVPVGTDGEIYIGGAGVARGYLHRPELTAERFIMDPFSNDPRARLYRTGDLGRWRPDGTIEYLGRNDSQVKIRGFRIELGEIETQLLRHPQVKEAALVAREDEPGEKRLVAYVVGQSASNSDDVLSPEILRAHLKPVLPDYMLPGAFVILDNLPLTANGKLNRRALPAPERGAYGNREYEAPRGEIEEILAGIWQALLRVERVGRQDNFFELGGHSLLIVQMLERLRRVGLSAEVRRVFDSPTLGDLASALGSAAIEHFTAPPNLIPRECDAITPQMLTLVSLEAEQIERIVQTVPGGAVNIQDIYPLAPLQEGVLFHHLLDAQRGDTYLLTLLLRVPSQERLDKLVAALQVVIDRYDILRTAVLWERLPHPVQVVYRRATLPLEEIVLDPSQDSLEQFREMMRPERQRLGLRTAPLLRLGVAADPHSAGRFALLQVHHIICDHETLAAIYVEAVTHCEARGQLPDSMLYRNHVAQVLACARVHDTERFFRGKLGDVEEPTAPFGLLDVHADGGQIEEARQDLEPALSQRARGQARRLSVSAATLFHAAWALVVAHTSGREDVVYGTVLLGRMQGNAGAQQALGLFINTLPIRLSLREVTAKGLVERTQRELVELLSYDQSSLALAQRCSAVAGSTPLFSALLNYRHKSLIQNRSLWESSEIQLLAAQERTNYPITISIDDQGEGFGIAAQTHCRIDPRRMVQYVCTAVQSLVQALERAPEAPALSLSILPEGERQQVLQLLNGTQSAHPQQKLVHELFEDQVRRTPDAVAIVYEGQRLTYAQLNAKANRLARYLRTREIGPDQLVGICVERSLEMVVGLLGILKAGGAYVPLDPSYPPERLKYMLDDAAPPVLLTQTHLRERLPSNDAEVIALDEEWGEIEEQLGSNLDPGSLGLEPHHLAYVIYTSGSTGSPKGVMVEHRNVTRLFAATDKWFEFNHRDVWTLFHSFAFDFSVWELWGAFIYGGRVVVVPYSTARSPREFYNLICAEGVTVLNQTPSAFVQLIDAQAQVPQERHSLRVVIFGGEALELHTLRPWIRRNGAIQTQLVNMYGITETTVHVTYRLLTEAEIESERGSPVGRPIEDLKVYLLGNHRQPVPIGVAGEMYIGGAGVARGYLNRPELTAERFIRDPFSSDAQERLYKTGDLARRRADGSLEYLGRNDYQVKIRGFRIELGEIEAQLLQHPQVKEAVVLAREDEPGEKRLVAYVVTKARPVAVSLTEEAISVEALRTFLKTGLPEFMVPSAFVMVDSFPLTRNGKLDRAALPAPKDEAYLTTPSEPPQGKIEQTLATIWQDLLKVTRVGRDDDFFHLGGNSLLGIRLIARVAATLGTQPVIATVFQYPTIREMGRLVEQALQVSDFGQLQIDQAEVEDGVL